MILQPIGIIVRTNKRADFQNTMQEYLLLFFDQAFERKALSILKKDCFFLVSSTTWGPTFVNHFCDLIHAEQLF